LDELWQLRVLLLVHVFRLAETPVNSCAAARASTPVEVEKIIVAERNQEKSLQL